MIDHRAVEYLVLVNYYDHDVSWAQRLKYPHVVYYKEQPDKAPYTAINRGKSETNLLKFIRDFYHQLPKNLILVHQYEHKFYHPGSLVDLLNHPNFEVWYSQSLTPGYRSFNLPLMGNIAPQIPTIKESTWWEATMESTFGPIEALGNWTEGKAACAQFVVSRTRIQQHPQEFYARMYQWYEEETLEEAPIGYDPKTLTRLARPTDEHPRGSSRSSRYLEWCWELIFTAYQWNSTPITIRGQTILALYGTNAYRRNVTLAFLKHCYLEEGFLIPASLSFNAIFTDPCLGTAKQLTLQIGAQTYLLPETHPTTSIPF